MHADGDLGGLGLREGRGEDGEARGERKRGGEEGSHEGTPAKDDGFLAPG